MLHQSKFTPALLTILVACICGNCFSQSLPGISKPVYKNGQFIFYGTNRLINTSLDNKPSTQRTSFLPAQVPGGKMNTQKVLSATSVIVLYIISTDATCGYGSGSIIVQATNGVAPYQYSLTDAYGYTSIQNTGNFPVVGSGPYTITATDANGDKGTATISIADIFPGPVQPYAANYKFSTRCDSANGSVVLSTKGGTPPYRYSIDLVNFQTDSAFNNLYPGTYSFYAKDANGCIGYYNYLNTVWACNTCFNGWGGGGSQLYVCGANGSATMSVLGQCGPVKYSLDGINYQDDGNFHGLGPGLHKVFFKDSSDKIFYVAGFNIAELCQIRIEYIAVDAACTQNNGSLTVSVLDGTAPYEYTVDGINYQSSNTFNGLAPGNYYITARDAMGIKSSLPATVYDKCPIVRTTITAESCAKNDGAITAGGFRGTPPYLYSIDGSNFQSSTDFTGLAAGTYTVTIKDNLGFTGTVTATVDYNCMKVNATVTNVVCGNTTGTITALAVNGTEPYSYSIDGVNFQSTNRFTGLAAGSYTITAKDVNGLTNSTIVLINDAPGPVIGTVNTTAAGCLLNDGALAITTNGGTVPLQYSLDGINYQASNSFAGLAPADYTVYLKDANGCSFSRCCSTVPLKCLKVTATVTAAICAGTNGSITVVATNGLLPYSFSIDGVRYQPSNVFSNLASGSYLITVKDAEGTIQTMAATVDDKCLSLRSDITNEACGKKDGSIVVAASSGKAPYQYSLDGVNFQSPNRFDNLAAGNFIIIAKDSDGVTGTLQVSISNLSAPIVTDIAITPTTCLNNDGVAVITASGVSLPLAYSIDGSSFQPDNSLRGLSARQYIVTVSDARNCTTIQPANISLRDNLVLAVSDDTTVCEGEKLLMPINSNGSLFLWTGSGVENSNVKSPVITSSLTGMYTVSATLGICTKKDSLLLHVNPAPVAVAAHDTTICFGQSTSLKGSGGVIFEWNPSQFLDDPGKPDPVVIKPTFSTAYTLQVFDGKGCKSLNEASVRVTVTPPAKLFAGNDTSVVVNEPFVLRATDVNNSGFVNYEWSPTTGLDNAFVQSPVGLLANETKYTVTATTDAGCKGSDEIVVKVFRFSEIYVPSAFTPNGDGKNDVLKAIPVGIRTFKHFTLFDRWGHKIFTTSNPSFGWDGRTSTNVHETSTFVWIAEGVDFKGNVLVRKGTVTLIK